MCRVLFLASILLSSAFAAAPSQAAEITWPMITVACRAFQPRASTFDCAAGHAVRESSVSFPSDLPTLDRTILVRQAYIALARAATDDCGGPAVCRAAYGVIGHQCLAIAQSAYYAGFGSFMGRETTRLEAEATAIRDCETHVGVPGAACEIVVSHCPPLP